MSENAPCMNGSGRAWVVRKRFDWTILDTKSGTARFYGVFYLKIGCGPVFSPFSALRTPR